MNSSVLSTPALTFFNNGTLEAYIQYVMLIKDEALKAKVTVMEVIEHAKTYDVGKGKSPIYSAMVEVFGEKLLESGYAEEAANLSKLVLVKTH